MKTIFTFVIMLLSFNLMLYSQDCSISITLVEAHPCDSLEQYLLDIQIDNEETSDSFIVQVNGDPFGPFSYEEVFVTVGPFAGDGETDLNIQVYDFADSTCTDFAFFEALNCEPSADCVISLLSAERQDCDGDGNYLVDVVVEAENASDSFELWINGDFMGIYGYDESPVTVGPYPGDGVTDLAFLVYDAVDSACLADFGLEALDCNPAEDCAITELFAERHDCEEDDTYLLDIIVQAENASDSFILWINGALIDTFGYNEVPVTVGPYPGDGTTDLVIVVSDMEDTVFCTAGLILEALNCNPDCVFTELFAERHDCDEDDNYLVDVIVLAEHASDSFDLWINGDLVGTYGYDESPVTVGPYPGDGSTDLTIIVYDTENSECIADFSLESIECNPSEDCAITELFAEAHTCDEDGNYLVDVIVRAENASDSFNLWINGDWAGIFSYDDVPVTVGPFVGDGETDLSIIVYDAVDSLCAADFRLEAVECEPAEDCAITELFAERHDCDDDGNYLVDIVVRSENASDSFILWINGNLIDTFGYNEVPVTVGPFPGDGETDLVIIVSDLVDTVFCTAGIILEALDCCLLSNLLVETSPCDEEGNFSITVFFQARGTEQERFDLFFNSNFLGSYFIDDLPLRLDNLEGRPSDYQYIRICINDNEDCCIEKEFHTPCCEEAPQECSMTNPRYKVWCTSEDEFYYILDFDLQHPSSDVFTIRGNGEQYGRFNYNSRPVILGPFERRSTREFEFIIQDTENEDCRTLILPGEIDCDNPNNIVVLEGSQMKLWSADNIIFIRDIPADGYRFSLHTLDGKRIRDQQLGWPQSEIHVGQLPYAYYIVSVEKGHNRYTAKVLLGY